MDRLRWYLPFLALANQCKYYEATGQTQNDWNEDK